MATVTIDQSKNWTVKDYLQLGEDMACQLINGELIMSPSPSINHQRISKKIFKIIEKYISKSIGEVFYSPVDVYLDDKNVFQPDLLILKHGSLQKISERGIEGAPDLVVEILSPSSSHIDRYHKREAYERFGVKEYWIVDPNNKTLEILHFATDKKEPVLYVAEEGEVISTELPDLRFELQAIFQG